MKPGKPITFTVLSLLLPFLTFSQVGGNSIYDFINLPASARITATAGNLITVKDDDVSLAFHNPSLLNKYMNNRFTAGTAFYFQNTGINFGNFNYVRDYPKIATFQAGIQYITYGKFDETNDIGQVIGEFNAKEFLINLGAGRAIGKYSYGVNLKFIISQLAEFNSFGMALDLAAAYHDSAKMFTATLLIKNIGVEMKSYYKGNREPLPFEIQAGFSKRFKHLPFMMSVIIHNLQKWDLRYDDPNADSEGNLFGEDTADSGNKAKEIFDNIARHFVFSGELYIKKVVRIGFGYNHQRRQELKVSTKKGLAGFSFGIGIRIKQFDFSYSRARYHIVRAMNHVTVGVNLNEFLKKKTVTTTSQIL